MENRGEEFSDVRVVWDWIKCNVRLFTINYSKQVAKTEREREEKLQRTLQTAQGQFQQNPCEEVQKILDECKADLENFSEEKANGLIVRARAELCKDLSHRWNRDLHYRAGRHLEDHDSTLHLVVVGVLVLNGRYCHFSAP